jgi:hypothetical protein
MKSQALIRIIAENLTFFLNIFLTHKYFQKTKAMSVPENLYRPNPHAAIAASSSSTRLEKELHFEIKFNSRTIIHCTWYFASASATRFVSNNLFIQFYTKLLYFEINFSYKVTYV